MTARQGFWLVIASQLLGATADGALLIVAIQLLAERHAPSWNTPALRVLFYASYVLMAPFAGAVADRWPKQRVLVATGAVKLCGCALLLAGLHPVAAYGLIGLGAVAHAPARYGILSELVAPPDLVAANGWMEAATIAASLLGVALASVLVAPAAATGAASAGVAWNAVAVLAGIYLTATVACTWVRPRPATDSQALGTPARLVRRFAAAARRTAADADLRTAILATSSFWAAAAVLQFIVLRWAVEQLGLSLSGAALLQGTFAVGAIVGAGAAGRWIAVRHAKATLPLGVALGAGLLLLAHLQQAWAAGVLLAIAGTIAGAVLVPMNALLQARATATLPIGQAVAVQHFSENAASVGLLAVYGVLTALEVPLQTCVQLLGGFLAVAIGAASVQGRQPQAAAQSRR